MSAAVQAAFAAAGPGEWDAFCEYVVEELGSVNELRGFGEQEIRDTFSEFEKQRGLELTALKRGKCVKELRDWSAGGSGERGTREESTRQAQGETLRHRGKGGHAAKSQPTRSESDSQKGSRGDERKETPPTVEEVLDSLSFRGQVAFLLFKAVLTIAMFTLLHQIFTYYVYDPLFRRGVSSPNDAVEEAARILRQSPRTFQHGGDNVQGFVP
eukprot:Hpha_TRINITY_DN31588_c0_g1::TRINITY_DN31588_c0_g1_i1::g.1688::m.1688